ncbi:MAG: RNA polymerase sigma factor [Ekhidna sp.]|nr:RNA polymerase sigma factor [Ekhidna sp.]
MDKKAFIKIIQENKGIIQSLCRSYYQVTSDQEDASQDIILQLWKSIDSFKAYSSIETWIYRVALNTLLSKRRKEKKTVQTYQLEQGKVAISTKRFDDDLELLKVLVQSLSDSDKAVMILYFEGYKNKEIASLLKISVSVVSTRLNRIRQKLKEKLKSKKSCI